MSNYMLALFDNSLHICLKRIFFINKDKFWFFILKFLSNSLFSNQKDFNIKLINDMNI